jgi:hypothetical protein
MSLPEWTQSGSNHYDYAINGIPFLSAASDEAAYARETAQIRKEQIDTSTEPGEQSLQNWWYRSQSSFDLGAGARFFDIIKDPFLSRRYFDSHGCDTLSEPGEITLLRSSVVQNSQTAAVQKVLGFSTATQNGVLHSYGSTLQRRFDTNAIGPAGVNWGASSTIFDLSSNGSTYFVMSGTGIYAGALPASNGSQLYRATVTDGIIRYAKERIVAAINNRVFVLPVTPRPPLFLTNISGEGGLITYTFANNPQITTGQIITVSGSNISGYNVNEAEVVSVTNNGLSVSVTGTATGTHSGTATMTILPIPLITSQTVGWKWSGIADGPNGIYLAGHVGDRSYIYRATLGEDSIELQPPSVVAELPHGEVAYSMEVYLGTYIIIGTNIGVRIGIMDAAGSLIIGPLTIETNNNVKALYVRSNYCWVGGADSDGKVGIYRINLSKQVDERQLLFAYEKNIFASTTDFTLADEVLSINPIGMTDRIAFTIANKGLVYESASTRVSSGWIETGKIRFDTAEEKIFQYLKVSNLTTGGTIATYWRDENNALSEEPIFTWDTSEIRVVNMEASDGQPHPWVSYRFYLNRSSTNNTVSPTLLNYQIKANPSGVKQRIIQLPLLAMQYEKGTNGMTIERDVWTRLRTLEEAEENGSVVVFQDLNTGERRLVLIEEVRFISRNIGSTPQQKKNKGGILIVQLRTVDNTVITESE